LSKNFDTAEMIDMVYLTELFLIQDSKQGILSQLNFQGFYEKGMSGHLPPDEIQVMMNRLIQL